MDPYRLWAQQLFLRARQLSGLDRRKVGETLGQLRERDTAFRRQTVGDWEDGVTDGSLANFLALCRLAGLEPAKVLSLVEDEEAAHEQASRHPALQNAGPAPLPLAPTADAAGGGRRPRRGPRLYVIGGGLLAALMLFLAAVTRSPNPAVWLGAVEVWVSQSAPIHRIYAGASPGADAHAVTVGKAGNVSPTPSTDPGTASPTPAPATPTPTPSSAPAPPAPPPPASSDPAASVTAQVPSTTGGAPTASVTAQVPSVTGGAPTASVTAQVPTTGGAPSASVTAQVPSVTGGAPTASVSAQVPSTGSPSVSAQVSTPPLPLPSSPPPASVGVQVNLP